MNIDTLLQAAQILESQHSIPPKKRIARADRQSPTNDIPVSILSSTTINTNPISISPSLSIIKTDNLPEYSQSDLNLNLHHLHHRVQHRSTYDRHNDDDDDDDDEDNIDQNIQNTNKNSDISNRVQTVSFRDREIHNRLEKDRRAHLKDCFNNLKAQTRCQRDRKITNLQVLNLAIKYIQTLTRKEREYEQEINLLASRSIELQQRLGTLKTELNSEGNNVDSWLGSCLDIDHSVSTCTASEAEMYRTFDDDDDNELLNTSTTDTRLLNGHADLDTNNNHHDIKSNINNSYTVDSKLLLNNRKYSNRSRQKTLKQKLSSIPTTNLLQTLPTRSENLPDYNVARHLHLDQPCNLLTSFKDNLPASTTTTLTPIPDIRYEIVDMFTKGTNSHLQQQQQKQMSPLPSIASLMNRHSSPIVSPTKQTIGINTDPLTTSTTNILHQPVATS